MRGSHAASEHLEKVLQSEEFKDLWHAMSKGYVPWEQFRLMPMPAGLSPERAWRMIAGLRKGAGTTFEYPPWFPFDEHGEIWFYTTQENAARLQEIAAQTSGGAKIARAIGKLDGYCFSHYLMLREFLEVCTSDGLALDAERASGLAFGESPAASNAEQLFVNLCTTFSNAGLLFKDRPITHGLIEDVQRSLLEGLQEPLPQVKSFALSDCAFYHPERVLDLICRLGRCQGADNPLHPLLAYGEIIRMFWDLRPLPALNACTELVVRKVFFQRYGYPSCAFLEMARVERHMRDGGASRYGFDMGATGYPEEYQLFGIDGTLYHDAVLREYSEELERLQLKVDRFIVKRLRQKRRVADIAGINQRQQDVLLNLLRNPLRTATIDQHRARHGIAYATAHDDLARLSSLGYLRQQKAGRKFAYTVGPKLLKLA